MDDGSWTRSYNSPARPLVQRFTQPLHEISAAHRFALDATITSLKSINPCRTKWPELHSQRLCFIRDRASAGEFFPAAVLFDLHRFVRDFLAYSVASADPDAGIKIVVLARSEAFDPDAFPGSAEAAVALLASRTNCHLFRDKNQ